MTAAQQLSLGYAPEHRAAEAWRLRSEWARRAVDTIGHKHVAFALDVAPSTLTDALKERDGKCLRGDHLATIEFIASPGQLGEYLSLINRPHGFEPTPIKTRTPEEKLRIVLDLLERNAPVLVGLIQKEIGP